MGSIVAPCYITVELAMRGDQENVVWMLDVEQYGYETSAKRLFDALVYSRDMLEPIEKTPLPRPSHLNMIYWTHHPSQEESIGILVRQFQFEGD